MAIAVGTKAPRLTKRSGLGLAATKQELIVCDRGLETVRVGFTPMVFG